MRARDNPYRVQRLHSLQFRFQGGSWDSLCDRLRALSWRGSVVGRKGSGKTTLLLELADALRARGFQVVARVVRAGDRASLERAEHAAGGIGAGGVLVLDGGDLLGLLQWRRIKALTAGRGLIVSSHRRRLLPVVHRCRASSGLLGELMRELHPGDGCVQPKPEELYDRHRGNLREALRELYDFHARWGCSGVEPASRRWSED